MPLLQANTLFKQVISKIITHVGELLAKNPVNYIYLVGGFAESKMLQKSVKVAFEKRGLHVIVPMRPQLMVVKGAVLFGLRKGSTIQSRLARYTYGFDSSQEYDASNKEHTGRPTFIGSRTPGEHVIMVSGCFNSLVQKGSKISVSQKVESQDMFPHHDAQTEVAFTLYSTDATNAKWIDGMTRIGAVTVPCIWGQKSRVAMSFGNTEVTATATNRITGHVTNATIKYNFNSL